jgi:hypothetical protein
VLQEAHAGRGAYPSHLSELTLLARTTATDPCSEAPFIYRRTETGYLLYGVDVDGRDDAGVPSSPGQLDRLGAGDLVAGKLSGR